jgi:hypothetical protein
MHRKAREYPDLWLRTLSLADISPQLSNAEMYKVVPEIVRRFAVKMAHDQPWTTRNAIFFCAE